MATPQSAAAPSPFPPIADYAFLSDCHTGALVAPDGAIDWLCVPRFDAPSVFGTLLDRGSGTFRFGPFGINHPSGRAYLPGTNTLITTWKTPTGWIEVLDALTMGPRRGVDTITPHTRPPTDDDGEHLLVRTAMCVEGSVEVELVCEPVFDYGRVPAEWTLEGDDLHTADARGADQAIRLRTDMALGIEAGRARARHTLHKGDQAFCSLSWAEGLASPADVDDAFARLEQTTRYWRAWLGRARLPDHRWRDPIQRSALAIKGLTYMPTGATVAALTTSLPETPGGERNWDYRYTWMRDTTFTLQALHWLNLDWEADEFMQFVADLEPNDDGALQIMYGIDGRRDLTESTRDDLSGYAGARPVRIGNGAFDQRQNDVFGAVLDSILLHSRRSQRLPRRLWPIVHAQAECATRVWREPDQGIWEARGEPQHYVSSKLMCWVALDRAAELAHIWGETELNAAWAATAEEIKADILEHGVDERGVLRQHYATDALDASTLLAAHFGFLPGTDERMRATRARDPGRADRARLRAALQGRRDRRRALRQGGHVPDLLLLARVRAGDHRRAPARAGPDGGAAAGGLPARAVCGGVRLRHRPPPGQLPPGLLAPRPDRRRGPHHPRRRTRRVLVVAHGPGPQHAYHEDIGYYDDRAYGLLASAEDGTGGAVDAFARHDAPLTRDGARTVIAREHGFPSWPALRRHVSTLRETGEPFARAYRAIEAHDVEQLAALLDRFPELVHARGTNDNDLLGMAGATCDERLVAILLDRGADVASANAHGWTPLHQAAYSDLPAMARMLLDAGAPVGVSARGNGGTPLVVALFWGNVATAELLAGHGVHPRNLRAAAGLGRLDLLEELIDTPEAGAHRAFYRPHSGFPAWQPSDDEQEVRDEALAWAARNGRVEALELLIERGASVDADVYRGTALSWAAACGRVEAIRRLVALGADPSRRTSFGGPGHGEGTTALHLAAQNGDLDTIRALLELGADPALRDDLHGGTPANWAEHGGHSAARDLLREE